MPVLDLKNLLVVRAVSGRREEYEPLVDSRVIPCPVIERALYSIYSLGYREIYIADIDLIEERASYDLLKILNNMLSIFDRVYIDVGRRGIEYYSTATERNIIPVIGTEYVRSDEIEVLSGKTISLDMYGRLVKLRDREIDYEDFLYIMYRFSIAPERVLIIDLERVGTFSGIDLKKVHTISRRLREMGIREVLYGGGIRDMSDIESLSEMVDSVIVGSALHRGAVR
ncbi:MAG: hypothetical protein GXO23_01835 [Crenarchaeota archaeon]|nr:hypothetical protein [Thermoproteota archaeon]